MEKAYINLKNRDFYLSQLISFQDTEPVKVITGIRRCGKSSLMKLMIHHLRKSGIEETQLIIMNFESMAFRNMNAAELYSYVKERVLPDKRMYLFFDEVQRVENWQDAINSFRVDFDSDIYITGSNAYLLSSEISTYLTGRFVEIKMLPLSFKEFLDFHGYSIEPGLTKKRIMNSSGELFDADDLLETYLMYGGMPGLIDVGLNQEKAYMLLDGIYSTVVVRDILEREQRSGQRRVTDAQLLRKILLFLADNIGNNVSPSSIGNVLTNEKLLDGNSKASKPAVQTIQAYIATLLESFVFYEIKRFDIKGKQYLRTLGKYYIVDLGLRNYLLGYRGIDSGHAIENLVFFELKRRGYDVAIGKVGSEEVDFIAVKGAEKKYIQVTERIDAESTKDRELRSLQLIKDNHEKALITRYGNSGITEDGIRIVNLCDYLLE